MGNRIPSSWVRNQGRGPLSSPKTLWGSFAMGAGNASPWNTKTVCVISVMMSNRNEKLAFPKAQWSVLMIYCGPHLLFAAHFVRGPFPVHYGPFVASHFVRGPGRGFPLFGFA